MTGNNPNIASIDYQRAAKLGVIVGYHNYFRVGVHEAVKIVQGRCPSGVTASYRRPYEQLVALDYGFFVVGQVRVHSGDPSYELVVDARDWLSAESGVPAVVAQVAGCAHAHTRNLYSQRPPSEGRRLVAVRRLCEDCGAVLKIAPKPQELK